MAHRTAKDGYKKLEERLNRFPQGAPPSKTLYQILSVLMTEQEAELVAQLPIKPFTVATASRAWNVSSKEASKTLDTLAGRAILLDIEHEAERQYMLPPPMAGFFEFSMMRTRQDLNQTLLAELLHQYLNVEEDFVKDLFFGSETRLGRVFVQEEALDSDNTIHILDFERASHTIQTAAHIGISMCYCRHKMDHLGQACDAPMNICMTFGNTAASLVQHEFARAVDAAECMDLLHEAYEHNLVQCGENVRQQVTFICNCCGCCCEALVAAKRFGILQPVATTNFLPEIQRHSCSSCGRCLAVCPVAAIGKDAAGVIQIHEELCLGCGVCVRACPRQAMVLHRRQREVITPVNSVHRAVLMAIEKGLLQNLIFDNQAFGSHRAMAAILGVILKLPPAKQALASKQFKSVYLDRILSRLSR